ncbi:ead/Ea22-like family protein [Citrobacter sp. CK197]|uniref:ead/Ea22-like family protein n=1 Tax=Citrobacter TaxID=544 RepID=UPI001903644C|nr:MULTISPECIES: ead/Ea22-like family protein [Citrobacter]EKX8765494.1 ead/Ea22-like family protein [Citrobacter koseri]MBJ9645256.1 ead/Ea22-like family protein [Citrobacter koseri]MDM2984102.1 ead/Ea22-like family protein [Citrobacter sp. CK197]MDM3008699.1 ead/Ea22-like family protein [Citrobacter sp. CK191]HED1841730.1 ead/Ea22-like family protein [Citrobacter koseri]
MTIDKQALREAAEKYRTTYAAHLKNPRNYDALDAWDKATSEFMALVNNDELNIIASLIDEIDMETGYREGAFVACNRWHTKFRETEAKLEAAEKRIAELREWNAGLAQESCLQQQRIAELEARTPTVKMPEPFKLAKSSSGLTYYYADEVDKALAAASINMEAE